MMTEWYSGWRMSGLAQLAEGAPQQEAPLLVSMMPMILMIGIFYFILIRPQNKARKEHETLVAALKTGDEIVTSGGILGTITSVKEKTVMVRIAEGVKIELLKSNVTQIQKTEAK